MLQLDDYVKNAIIKMFYNFVLEQGLRRLYAATPKVYGTFLH